MAVPELEKAAGRTCDYCSKRCDIYETRPNSCREFECVWLQSQRRAPLPPWLRPDRCGAIMLTDAAGRLVLRVSSLQRVDRRVEKWVIGKVKSGLPILVLGDDGKGELYEPVRHQ
jgi:hypothetical protein